MDEVGAGNREPIVLGVAVEERRCQVGRGTLEGPRRRSDLSWWERRPGRGRDLRGRAQPCFGRGRRAHCAGSGAVGDFGTTGWVHYSGALAAGSYQLNVTVQNNTDEDNWSVTEIDNIDAQVNGAPEPASLVLIATGLVGVAAAARRKRAA